MLGECPPRSIDEALAVGERLSALMLAEFLESEGIRAEAINGGDVITTDAVFGNATPLMPQTRVRVAAVLKPLLEAHVLPVVTGFNASTEDRRPTTLGRGGSGFYGLDSGGGNRRERTLDLDRCGWNHDGRPALGLGCPRARRGYL